MAMGSPRHGGRHVPRARVTGPATAGPSLLFVSTNNLGELYLARGEAAQGARALPGSARQCPRGPRTRAQEAHPPSRPRDGAERTWGTRQGARLLCKTSLEINLANKLIDEAAADYYMIASVHSLQGDYEEADKNAQLALAWTRRSRTRPGIAQDLYALGLIAKQAQRHRRRLRLFPEIVPRVHHAGPRDGDEESPCRAHRSRGRAGTDGGCRRATARRLRTWGHRERRIEVPRRLARGGSQGRVLPASSSWAAHSGLLMPGRSGSLPPREPRIYTIIALALWPVQVSSWRCARSSADARAARDPSQTATRHFYGACCRPWRHSSGSRAPTWRPRSFSGDSGSSRRPRCSCGRLCSGSWAPPPGGRRARRARNPAENKR